MFWRIKVQILGKHRKLYTCWPFRTIPISVLLNDALQLENCWLRSGCEKFSRLFRRESILIIRTNHTKKHFFYIFHLSSLCFEELTATSDILVFFYEFFKKLIDSLLTEMQPLVLEGAIFVFQEKSDRFHILALLVYQVCEAMTFSTNVVIQWCSEHKNISIVTMVAASEQVVLKRIESLSRRFIQICTYWQFPRIRCPLRGTEHSSG